MDMEEGDIMMRENLNPTPEPTRPRSVMWKLCGQGFPRSEIVFFSQILLILCVVVASIYNLTAGTHRPNLWTALLSSSIGYVLPNPSLKIRVH